MGGKKKKTPKILMNYCANIKYVMNSLTIKKIDKYIYIIKNVNKIK